MTSRAMRRERPMFGAFVHQRTNLRPQSSRRVSKNVFLHTAWYIFMKSEIQIS